MTSCKTILAISLSFFYLLIIGFYIIKRTGIIKANDGLLHINLYFMIPTLITNVGRSWVSGLLLLYLAHHF